MHLLRLCYRVTVLGFVFVFLILSVQYTFIFRLVGQGKTLRYAFILQADLSLLYLEVDRLHYRPPAFQLIIQCKYKFELKNSWRR